MFALLGTILGTIGTAVASAATFIAPAAAAGGAAAGTAATFGSVLSAAGGLLGFVNGGKSLVEATQTGDVFSGVTGLLGAVGGAAGLGAFDAATGAAAGAGAGAATDIGSDFSYTDIAQANSTPVLGAPTAGPAAPEPQSMMTKPVESTNPMMSPDNLEQAGLKGITAGPDSPALGMTSPAPVLGQPLGPTLGKAADLTKSGVGVEAVTKQDLNAPGSEQKFKQKILGDITLEKMFEWGAENKDLLGIAMKLYSGKMNADAISERDKKMMEYLERKEKEKMGRMEYIPGQGKSAFASIPTRNTNRTQGVLSNA